MLPCTWLQEYRLLEDDEEAEQPPVPGLRLVRPLLEVTRDEIEAYNEYHGLAPRFDRSNLDTTYFRNWLRHEVLPLLAQHNPNVREVIRRSARVVADDYALLRSLLMQAWDEVARDDGEAGRIVFDLGAWRSLPTALQRATLREAIHRLRRTLRNISFMHVENALSVARDGTTGDQSTLPRGLMLTVGYDRLTIGEVDAGLSLPDWPLLPADGAPLPVAVPGDTPLPDGDWLLRSEVLGWDALTPDWASNPDPWQAFLDAGAGDPGLWLRTRRPGDRFQPLGMDGHTVKLSDFLTNQKVPLAARDRLPLLVTGGAPAQAARPAGTAQILWVPGWRIDEGARVRDRTERVLVLRFLR
jgi:tRNA(Ile)-lysidine synthase